MKQAPRRILIAEDETFVHELWKNAFGFEGVEASTTPDGSEALSVFDQADGSFDAIITDFDMPVMNGLQLIEEIRKRNSSVPLYLYTSHEIGKSPLTQEVVDGLIAKGVFIRNKQTCRLIRLVQEVCRQFQ